MARKYNKAGGDGTIVMPPRESTTIGPGNRIGDQILPSDIQTTPGAQLPAMFTDDAAATIVWGNFQRAKAYVENYSWLMEWQYTDILYQSPTLDRYPRVESGRPARISRFIVAKMTNTMERKVKRAVFTSQTPFLLKPKGKATEKQAKAWTTLIMECFKKAGFEYNSKLQMHNQTLQGTGIGRWGIEERTEIKKTRVAKKKSPEAQPVKITLPATGPKTIPTVESDEFEVREDEITEVWPFYENRGLGETLFDPKWRTPNRPCESAAYALDVDYCTFEDLQKMREMDCYEGIPSDEVLKEWLSRNPASSAPPGSQVAQTFAAQGSMVTHGEGPERQTSANPLDKPFLLLEETTKRTKRTLLHLDGEYHLIRNEVHDMPWHHLTCNWWSIAGSGYGLGCGRLAGPDQRIHAGVVTESLKMIAYPMNAPIVHVSGQNNPSQNIINRLGGFWPVELAPGMNDVMRAIGFLPMPQIPADAWKMLQYSMENAEDVTGANSTMAQGNLGGPGSSAARTATGAQRIASMSDENVNDPVDNFADGVLVPSIEFVMWFIKEKMPIQQMRGILQDQDVEIVLADIEDLISFMNFECEITVLCGQRLLAKQGISQMLPIFLQMLQQPQLLEYLHQRGATVDFETIINLMLQVSELEGEDDIIRPLTEEEMQTVTNLNPNAQRAGTALQVEKLKGSNKVQAIQTQGQTDLANKAAEIALQRTAEGIPFERATALVERGNDENFLRGEPLN